MSIQNRLICDFKDCEKVEWIDASAVTSSSNTPFLPEGWRIVQSYEPGTTNLTTGTYSKQSYKHFCRTHVLESGVA